MAIKTILLIMNDKEKIVEALRIIDKRIDKLRDTLELEIKNELYKEGLERQARILENVRRVLTGNNRMTYDDEKLRDELS